MAKARTAKQKAALRKAQLASARKRRGKGRGRSVARKRGGSKLKTAAKVVGVATAIGAAAYTSHKLNGQKKKLKTRKTDHGDTDKGPRVSAPKSGSYRAGYAKTKFKKKRKGAPKSRSFRANMARTHFNMANMSANIQKFRR